MSEHSTYADIDGERLAVVVSYELDGYKPLIYGVFTESDDEDLTLVISEAEFDRIHAEVSQHVIEDMTERAEMYAEGER